MTGEAASRSGKGKGRKRRLHFREEKSSQGHLTETVGADLRQTRTQRGLSINDIAQTLRIKPDFVRAIEESDFDALPGKTYAIGFVRAYADIMGAKSEEYMRRFKAEMIGAEELKFNAITAREKRKPIPVGQLLTVAVVLVLSVVLWRNGERALSAGADVLEAFKPNPPADLSVAVEGYSESRVSEDTLHETTDRAPRQVAGPERHGVQPGSSGDLPAASDEGSGAGSVAPAGEEAQSGAAAAEGILPFVAEPARPEPSPMADGTRWGSENHDARLRLKALSDVWLRIEVDGHVMFERVLRASDSYSPPNSATTTIATRNAGALEVYVDGAFLRPLGETGQAVAGRVLDPDKLLTGAP